MTFIDSLLAFVFPILTTWYAATVARGMTHD
jgi:hypothetical protein